jgi:hypothetical protein
MTSMAMTDGAQWLDEPASGDAHGNSFPAGAFFVLAVWTGLGLMTVGAAVTKPQFPRQAVASLFLR